MNVNKEVMFKFIKYSTLIPALFILFMISRSNYILYHSVIEVIGVVIACGVFMISHNSRMYMNSNFFAIIGISFLFAAFIDFLHLLTYKGMSVFPDNNADIPTQLWIASGYIRSISFVMAPLFLAYKVKIRNVVIIYTFATFLLIYSIFILRIFPACFIEGSGLTSFKIFSEYIISVILIMSIVMILKNRTRFDGIILKLLIAAIVLTIASEMSFTLYSDVYGFSNFSGHILKLAAYALIYKAVIHTGLRKPYDLLFRDLKQNEEKLINALSEIKKLSGILPICAACKKIRNDKGYWQKVEEYISEHSDAKFSHGICQDCAKNLYPEVFSKNDPVST